MSVQTEFAAWLERFAPIAPEPFSWPITEPEQNSYHIALNLEGVRKRDVMRVAEMFRAVLAHELPDSPAVLTVAHIKGTCLDG